MAKPELPPNEEGVFGLGRNKLTGSISPLDRLTFLDRQYRRSPEFVQVATVVPLLFFMAGSAIYARETLGVNPRVVSELRLQGLLEMVSNDSDCIPHFLGEDVESAVEVRCEAELNGYIDRHMPVNAKDKDSEMEEIGEGLMGGGLALLIGSLAYLYADDRKRSNPKQQGNGDSISA